MITNSQTHYQTCFKVESTDDEVDAFIILQRIVYGWIRKRESDRRVANQPKEFFFRCDWRNLWETHSSVGTNTFLDGDHRAWSMRYAHPDSGLGARRYWFTDVGINFDGRVATLYVRNSFARGRFDLAVEQDQPQTTTPKFVRQILHNDTPLRVYSRSPKFPLRSVPGQIRLGMGKALAEALLDPERRYAILVANGDSEDLLAEADALAGDLAGKSQVFVIQKDQGLAEEIRTFLPRDLLIPLESVRIFYPLDPANPHPERHRWFHVSTGRYRDQREGILNGLLRNYTLEEDLAITNISDVGRLITLNKLRKLAASNEGGTEDLSEFYRMFEQLEEDRDRWKAEASQWASEYDAKDQELRELKSRHYLEKEDLRRSASKTDFDICRDLATFPTTLREVVELQSKIHSGRLAFADEAFTSAEEYENCAVIDRAWEILNHLGTTLYEIKFGDGPTGDIAARFQEKSGYEYAATEGRQSKRDKSICDSRKMIFEGREFEIWPHIKFGTEPPRMIRVHFDYDEENQRIVIGYVGEHMRNATSRARK